MATPLPNKTPAKHPRQPAGKLASSQRYLDVAQIRDGVVVLRDGSLRSVILVNAVNFALKSEEEQNALIYAYQGFLNSFNFPIQIVMQSRQLDLAHYLKKLSDQLAETTNELVQIQIADYIQFIERLIQIANIMDKKFYVVVPFTPTKIIQRGVFDKLFNPGNRLEVRMSPAEFKSYRQELLERSRIIMSGLGGMGLRSALLGTQETIELLYATYNPEEATKERLSDFADITGVYVHPLAKPADGAIPNGQIPSSNQAPMTNVQMPANPLATVGPEDGQAANSNGQGTMGKEQESDPAAGGQQPTATETVILSSAKDLDSSPPKADQNDNQTTLIELPTQQPTAAATPVQANSKEQWARSNGQTTPAAIQQPTGEIVLPEPLPPISNAPAESPEAGRAMPGQAMSNEQGAMGGTEPQPLGGTAVPVATPPTTGFGQDQKIENGK